MNQSLGAPFSGADMILYLNDEVVPQATSIDYRTIRHGISGKITYVLSGGIKPMEPNKVYNIKMVFKNEGGEESIHQIDDVMLTSESCNITLDSQTIYIHQTFGQADSVGEQ